MGSVSLSISVLGLSSSHEAEEEEGEAKEQPVCGGRGRSLDVCVAATAAFTGFFSIATVWLGFGWWLRLSVAVFGVTAEGFAACVDWAVGLIEAGNPTEGVAPRLPRNTFGAFVTVC